MRKTIAAVAAGILLVAGQAAAQNSGGAARVGDRLGASASESSELMGTGMGTLITIGVMVGILAIAISDASDSD